MLLAHGLRGPQNSDALDLFQQAGRDGAGAFTVSLDIELDQPWEQELVRLFVEAAIATAALENSSDVSSVPQHVALSLFAQLGVPADSVSSLLRGKLEVAYSARHPGLWWAAWNFEHNGQQMQLGLKGPAAGRLQWGHMAPWIDNAVASARRAVPPLGYNPSDAARVPAMQVLQSILREEYSPLADKPQPSAVDFSLMLNTLDETGAFTMEVSGVTNGNAVEPDSLGALARALNLEQQSREGRTRFDFRFILAEVLRRSLVLTDNRRLPLQRHFPLADLASPVDLRDGSAVAGELYRLKNGSPNEQQRFEHARRLFTEITDLPLRLRSNPADETSLTIDILVGPDEHARVAQFAGAGIQEALLLATLIAGEPGRVVVLDEPAVNLHPTMQRRLSRHLTDVQGLVITHSPDLIPCSNIDDLDRVVRLTGHATGTQVASLPAQNRKGLNNWLQNLLLTDVRALLFASGVILCEGATDLGALGRWWADGSAGHGDPEGANIALVDVGGDNNFGGYINYLEAFQIPWAAVADGPAFWPPSGLNKQLTKLGLAPDERPGNDAVFDVWLGYLNRAGIFTVATSFGKDPEKSGEFEAFLKRLDEQLLERAQQEQGNSKPRVGAAFAAAHTDIPQEVAALYKQIRAHLSAKGTRQADQSG
ncbi:ATP-dependent endonuclease [Streptacidiphilus sp. MAP12-33]|uniref:ATP-dependent nuclease n=1 Tax=Streptacidiphilus sp. MAP12-33 TaxID=3156266 RepID=UPI0035173218